MKTKTTLFAGIVLVISMLSMPAFSQIRFGIRAGVDMENPTFTDALKVENLTSYQLGPAIEAMFPFSSLNFGVEAALLYSDNRMTVSNLTDNETAKDISNRYLMVPLNLKLKLPVGSESFKLYANAGPYGGYLLSGDKFNFSQIGKDIKAKNFQAGINLGIGFELFKMVQAGANYQVKLTDNYATDKPNWDDPLNGKSKTWSISLGLFF